MIRVLVADDHSIVRRGVTGILAAEPDLVVCGEAATCAEALAAAESVDCDVMLLDLNMPGRGGFDVLQEVRRLRPSLPVVVLSMYPEEEFAPRVLRAGANGYLNKETAPDELVRAIRTVVSGGRYVSQSLGLHLAAAMVTPRSETPHEDLSDREYQVFVRLAGGSSTSDIAVELALSSKTVSTYRSRVLEKLHLRTNADLVRYAIEHKLVN
ncbi:MAG TPA: response regulator transcription factor [Vicinamibacterales bacterium]|nr:response regulator transcription factor [Vicinamibacterales bacterium]